MSDKGAVAINWALERGLYLDKRIERKEQNGIYGMYAKETIPKGTLFVCFPKDQQIPLDGYSGKNDNINLDVKVCYSAALELSKGLDSEYLGCVAAFDDLDFLKSHSIYYFQEEDFQVIDSMNPIMGFMVRQRCRVMKRLAVQVKDFAPELDDCFIDKAVMNRLSRAWSGASGGFIPVVDLFNHSDSKGATIKPVKKSGKDYSGLVAVSDYEKGDQIYGSYGRKDLVSIVCSYNYFDASGPHFIDFAQRGYQSVPSVFKEKLIGLLAQKYQCRLFESGGHKHVNLTEPDLFFTEQAPTLKLIQYFRESSFENEEQLASGKVEEKQVLANMLSTVDAYLAANKIDDFKLKSIPSKLHRFYHALKKEKAMLKTNRDWILANTG